MNKLYFKVKWQLLWMRVSQVFKKDVYLNDDQINYIYLDTLYRAYKKSTPSVNFYKLMGESDRIDDVIQIPFNDYEIERNVFEKIYEKQKNRYKMSVGNERKLSINVFLGAAPKYKK